MSIPIPTSATIKTNLPAFYDYPAVTDDNSPTNDDELDDGYADEFMIGLEDSFKKRFFDTPTR